MPAPVNLEMLEMLQWFERYGFFGGKDIKPSQEGLAKPANTWAEFVKAHKSSWE